MPLPPTRLSRPAPAGFHAHAFSLIELIGVIAVIAVLVSLLVPLLHSMRGSANLVICTSNQKQLHAGIVLYAQDNGGDLPPAYSSATGKTWSSLIDGYMDDGRKNRKSVFACPDALDLYTPDLGFSQATYGMNGHIPAAVSHVSSAPRPEKFCLLSEASLNGGGKYYNAQLWGAGSNRPLGVHEGRANVLFLDGHVELLGESEIPYGISTPEGKMFWRGAY